jgi:SAM-dependent methyltransferase
MMTNWKNVEEVLTNIFEEGSLILATMSAPHNIDDLSKVIIRPVLIKGQLSYQATEHRGQQALHQNLTREKCLEWLRQHLSNFKQTFFFTTSADFHLLVGKKGHFTFLKKAPTKSLREIQHNRQKQYIWPEGIPIPFLIQLGVMNSEGKVYAAKQDKFRQINRFLEMIDDVLPHLDSCQPLRIIDFGCGKAYLTFALYHFLKVTKNFQVHMVGLDLKKDVIRNCQELAQTLGCNEDLFFIQEDINDFQTEDKADMVVSLHACDTATDAALEKGVRWKARVILCVPCCQHELLPQIHQESLRPILKHGILKERFAALATDAARVQLLEVLGYQTQILEFIDLENTPKNLLIRAVKHPHSKAHREAAWQTYLTYKKNLNIDPSLERRFLSELKQLGMSGFN